MKPIFSILIITLFCQQLMAQEGVSSSKITSIQVGNNQKDSTFIELDLSKQQPIKLSYNQNYVQFNFINSQNPSQKSFSYKLNGLDYSWITCNDCSQVFYAHLDGGDYSFQVKTTQSGDIPTKFNFTVEGNIWHRWWFVPMLFLYFLVFIGIVVYLFALFQFRQKLKEQRSIHKEKMNSMAELTSGIAHEIQNPLNFVNNFSELSVDLARELSEEIGKIDISKEDKEYINEIISDLSQNQEKINHHGKRVSRIVNGMVEHSRINIGEFELGDLDKIIEEQFNHTYTHFKAKNPNFIIQFQLNKDAHLPKIKMIPDEIARLFLNLFNNAFYAMEEVANPELTISTQKVNNQVIIHAKDNGMGMSKATKAKIFQPFFTTKPTGEGTGLGLSLAYDIVTKGHGGTIECESVEGEGTTFIVRLPIA